MQQQRNVSSDAENKKKLRYGVNSFLTQGSYNGAMRRFGIFLLLWFLMIGSRQAMSATFDLAGPKMDVRVKRGTDTLPIAAVPNLQSGDRLWVHPDLPESQSERFVLVVAFLRGVTNPPPADWFTRVETWTAAARTEGVFVTVPKEAQQAVLFLVPETGGDFNTLKKAVHDEPGSFVRAVQDLQVASLDRMRVEDYLNQVKVTSQSDQKTLKVRAEMAARSLGVKINHDCFDKPAELQAGCLAQNPDTMVLDDSGAQSRVAQLTSGSTGDLMSNISASSMGGSGAYSAYVGAVVDMAKIFSSMHTARFRYIPALALPTGDTLNLRLATPPSFRNPKSVVVVALPRIEDAKKPPLHPVNPTESYCVVRPDLVLPAEGAPLVFATEMAHHLVLHVEERGRESGSADLPVVPDSSKGGLVLEAGAKTGAAGALHGELTGELRGKWGFENWTGPRYHLHAVASNGWTVSNADQSALVVGRDDTLHIEGENTLCVERVEARGSDGTPVKVVWKSPKPNQLELNVALKDVAPGQITFAVHQYGQEKPETFEVKAYADAASLERFALNAGDKEAHLKGTRLDEVASLELNGVTFTPTGLARVADSDQLTLKASGDTAKLVPGARIMARVTLRDGRVLRTTATIEPPRPRATLASKGVQPSGPTAVEMGSADDLPLDGRLVFFLKSVAPPNFPRDTRVELAAVDGGFHTLLSLADGSLILQDARTLVGSLEPLARFGSSAFGPVQVRVLAANGTAGEWLPLGTLVRLPGFKELRCPHAAQKPCTLIGNNLFLAVAFSAARDFSSPVEVPPEFIGTQIAVPHSAGGVLYMKLRDDPAAIAAVTLPVTPTGGETKPPLITPQPGPGPAPAADPASPQTAPVKAPESASPAAAAETDKDAPKK